MVADKNMWFKTQGLALAFDDAHDNHIVIAQDISHLGHKRYGAFPLCDIDNFQGPYYEVIRTKSRCRLYFDIDGTDVAHGAEWLISFIEAVKRFVHDTFAVSTDAIVLCSSNDRKFSKHVIFDVVFANNWEDMRYFVRAFLQQSDSTTTQLVDNAVYTRNRCFRMAGCFKFGHPDRVFRPGLPSNTLVQVFDDVPYQTFAHVADAPTKTGIRGISTGPFDLSDVNVPDDWKKPLTSFNVGDLLRAIHPNQPYKCFFSIGCAFKRAGGAVHTFYTWCREYREQSGVYRQFRGWNKAERGYGYNFLKQLAVHSSSVDEVSTLLEEAFGFHPTSNVTHIDAQYLDSKPILAFSEQCLLIKSGLGSGKSTVARQIAYRYRNKRILYLVSSRPLSHGAKSKLNASEAFRTDLNFTNYLDTDKPLHGFQHLVCSIQSLWRAARVGREPYQLIICDELSSIIEDMCNVTIKHPRANMNGARWFFTRCEKWIGLDAHLMDTSLILTRDYFTDIRVVINHHQGVRRNAVFIPKPRWTGLDDLRAKAYAPSASIKDVQAFSDATCLYDLLFKCWTNDIKTFFVCNNRKLGEFIQHNYLRRSYTWLSLISTGFYDDIATLICDFACKKGDQGLKLIKYAWIHKGDGRTGSDFKSLDWWSDLDHIQYTLKICCGLDYNPKEPHFQTGFCYTTPNTAVPRRILQQNERVRKLTTNTVYFSLGTNVVVKHLPVFGLRNIEQYANDQELFMHAVVRHHNAKMNIFDWMFQPEPGWKQMYLRCMNERECYLKYPQRAFEWWLEHDHWNISRIQTRPRPVIHWETTQFSYKTLCYSDIELLDHEAYEYLNRRRNLTEIELMQVKKYRFLQTFTEPSQELWTVYSEHPAWVGNALLERFGTLDSIIKRRFGLLVPTQTSNSWLDMTAAKLVIVRKIARKLRIEHLWDANESALSPTCYNRAFDWVERNHRQIRLAFGLKHVSLKNVLFSWSGIEFKTVKRIRRKVYPDAPFPSPDCSVEKFTATMEKYLPQYKLLYGDRMLKKNTRAFLRKMHREFKAIHTPVVHDESLRTIKSPAWNVLRHPSAYA